MTKKSNSSTVHFHRAQIGRAQRFMRAYRHEDIDLKTIAREAGASSFHFGRLYHAYTGETVFEYLRRIRISLALQLLDEDREGSITEIALAIGYETPSSFNKVFKFILSMTPTDFRNLGKESRDELIYSLSKSPLMKEFPVNLSKKIEIVDRPSVHFLGVEKRGPFQEVAQVAWPEMFELIISKIDKSHIREFIGMSGLEKNKKGDDAQIYLAGLGLTEEPSKMLKGAVYRKIKAGRYAKFLLKGSYNQIWPAFRQIFITLAENNVVLREEFCIENYLNDPASTPEPELITEILVPVK